MVFFGGVLNMEMQRRPAKKKSAELSKFAVPSIIAMLVSALYNYC